MTDMDYYRVFSRRWWKDAKCTIPNSHGRKITIQVVRGEDEARKLCRSHNYDADGNRTRRPYGSAWEYEKD